MKTRLLLAVLAVAFLAAPGIVNAKGKGHEDRKARMEKRKARHEAFLAKLKEKNPEKYAEAIKTMKEMKALRKSDPEAWKTKRKELKEKRKAAHEKWRAEHKARMGKHLEKLKEKNPEKYAEIMARRKKMEELRKSDPEAWKAKRKELREKWKTTRKAGKRKGMGKGMGKGKE